MSFSIKEQAENIQILEVKDLFDELENKKVLRAASATIERGFNRIIVDLTGQEYMNSVGLNLLISLFTQSKEAGGGLTIVNPSLHILKLMEITKLKSFFTYDRTVEDALHRMQY